MLSRPTDDRREATVVHLVNGEHIGGIERVVTTVCRLHRRVRPRLVCLMNGAMQRAAGVAVDAVPMFGRLDATVGVRLARYLREHGVSVVVAHTLRAHLVGAMAARLARLPLVATIHSPITRDTERRGRNARNAWLQRQLARWTAAYVTVSEGLERELVASGVPPSRVTVVRNGVEAERYEAGDGAAFRRSLPGFDVGSPLVGTVALLRPRKGIEDLLRAAPRVVREFPRCRFVVVGSAENASYQVRLGRLCGELGIADRVAFTGHRDDVADLLAALDVFVLPSRFGEGLPLALLEAMAAARAVVATETEGNREIIEPGVTGRLVPSADPAALADNVAALLADPAGRSAIGEAARRAVKQRFDAARMAAEAEDAYLRVLAETRSR